MVTNKTRLLSALMAILMLVSLFTGIVLPVTADTGVAMNELTSVTNLVAGTKNDKGYYSVASKAELELLASNKATLGLTAADTIFFTADIDLSAGLAEGAYYSGPANNMDGLIATLDGRFAPGGAATIKGLNLTSPWLGHYVGGTGIQNLVFDNCRYIEDEAKNKNYRPGMIFGGYEDNVTTVEVSTMTLKNITMRDCKVDGTATAARMGFMFGRIAKAKTAVIEDITMEGCDFTPGGNGNTGFLCAELRNITDALTIKNIYMNGNAIEKVGVTNHNILIGESTVSNLTLSNAIVINTEVPDGIKGFGLFTQKAANSKYALHNTVFLNNGAFSTEKQSSSKSSGGSSICYGYETSTNAGVWNTNSDGIYSDTAKISWYVDETAQSAEQQTAAYNKVVSGQAAWELNVAKGSGDQYYTMIADEILGTAPAFGTAENKTVKVIVNIEGTDEVRIVYANLNQVINVTHPGLLPESAVYTSEYGTIADGKLTLNASAKDAPNLTIEVNGSGSPNKAALEALLEEIGEDAKFYLKGDVMLSETTDVSDAQAVLAKDNATVSDVATAIEKLEAYTRVTVDDKDAKEVQLFLNLDVFVEDTTALLTAVNNAFAMPETDAKAIVAKNAALASAVDAFNATALTAKAGAKVPHKYHENELFTGVKDWLITDPEDWKTLVGRGAEAFTDESVTLTKDIDFKGDTIEPLVGSYSKKTYLNINGNGFGFKNVTIKIALIYGYYYGTLSDFHLDDTCKIVSTSDRHAASFVSRLYGTLKNCWSEAYIKHTGEGYDERVGGLVGEHAGGLIDGCYFAGTIECTDDYQVAAISDWYVDQTHNSFAKPTYVIPEGIEGKSNGVSAPGLFRGRIHTYYQTYTDLIKNTYGVGVAAIYQNADYVVTPIYTNGGVEYDARDLWNYNEMQKATNDEYANGALAWKLTANSTHKGTDEVTYYTVKDGKTVHAKSADEQMRRITLKQGEIEYYAYVVNGTAFTYGGEDYVADQDLVITVDGVLPTEHSFVCTDVKTGKHIETCSAEGIVIAEGIVATCGLKELKDCTYDIPYDIPATCTEDGKRGMRCVCGHIGSEEKTDDMTGHNMQVTTPEEPAKCGVAGTAAIYTCANGCGETEGGDPIPALNHDMQISTPEEPAKCEVAGKTAIYTCANGCGKTEGGEPIDALEHDMQLTAPEEPAKCGVAGKTAVYTCANNCGKTEGGAPIDALEHDYDEGTVTKPASVTEEGELTRTCKNNCGIPKIEPIAKLAALAVAPALSADQKTVTVDVTLLNRGAKEVTLTVNYDYTNMSLAENGIASDLFTAEMLSNENGAVVLKLTAAADAGADQKVLTLTFNVKTNVQGGISAFNGTYVFTATAEGTTLAGSAVDYEDAAEQSIEITMGITDKPGDLNRDDKVDMVDAILLLRLYNNDLPAEYATVITEDMADLCDEGDGEIVNGVKTPEFNINDVIHMLRFLNGWIDTL